MTAIQINLSERILKQHEIVMKINNDRLIFSCICVGRNLFVSKLILISLFSAQKRSDL